MLRSLQEMIMRISTLAGVLVSGTLMLAGCFGSNADEDDDESSAAPGWGTGGGDGGPGGGDSDGDGLSDADEATYGTDPDVADTDGDGYTDGEEVEGGTNPTFEYSHPYTGDYNVGNCEDGVAEGSAGPSGQIYQAGDIAANFTMMDQYGEMVDLYSFCGRTVMMVTGAFW